MAAFEILLVAADAPAAWLLSPVYGWMYYFVLLLQVPVPTVRSSHTVYCIVWYYYAFCLPFLLLTTTFPNVIIFPYSHPLLLSSPPSPFPPRVQSSQCAALAWVRGCLLKFAPLEVPLELRFES